MDARRAAGLDECTPGASLEHKSGVNAVLERHSRLRTSPIGGANPPSHLILVHKPAVLSYDDQDRVDPKAYSSARERIDSVSY